MSVFYEITEYLSLQPGANAYIPNIMAYRLANFGRCILLGGKIDVYDLRIAKGSEEAVFSGSLDDLKKAISLLLAACDENNKEAMELLLSYHCRYYDGLIPFDSDDIVNFLDDKNKMPDEELSKVSYVLWNNADCGDGMGCVVCYGLNSAGVLCRGEAPYEKVDTLPADASWFNNKNEFIYDDYGGRPFTKEIAEACRRLSIASGEPHPEKAETICVDGKVVEGSPELKWDGVSQGDYYLDFISLPTVESVYAHVEAAKEYLAATKTERCETDFIDTNAARSRMLRITLTPDTEPEFEITKV